MVSFALERKDYKHTHARARTHTHKHSAIRTEKLQTTNESKVSKTQLINLQVVKKVSSTFC